MLRIITGTAKNRQLTIPDIEGYRGVQEVAKSAVFSILDQAVIKAKCLDLYAGSGNMGLESLSRGALKCDFVDEDPEAIRAIEENLFKCGFLDNYTLTRKDCIKFVYKAEQTYDVIFCDPFYKDTSHKHLLKGLDKIISPKGSLFFFHDRNLDLSTQITETAFKAITTRVFGQSAFTVLTK